MMERRIGWRSSRGRERKEVGCFVEDVMANLRVGFGCARTVLFEVGFLCVVFGGDTTVIEASFVEVAV